MNQTTLNQNIQQIQKGIEAFHQFILDFMGFIEFLAQNSMN